MPEDIPFPCDTAPGSPGARSATRPTSVHRLRPGDIDVVGAMGDSLTAGSASAAANLVEIIIENRGMSWSGGESNTSLPTLARSWPLPVSAAVPLPKVAAQKLNISVADGLPTSMGRCPIQTIYLKPFAADGLSRDMGSGVPRNFVRGGGSTNSVEDTGQRERGSGGGSPLVRGSGNSCNLVQEI